MARPSFESCFPFSDIRPEQRKAINFATEQFLKEGKKFVILEMGPGCGKSATGITVARYLQMLFEQRDPVVPLGGTYVLTTQKVLQEQYMRDFGGQKGQLKLIKSAGSYTCQFFEDRPEGISCGEIQRLLKSTARCAILYKACEARKGQTSACKFVNAREEFLNSPEGITNYAYFLTAGAYSKMLHPRGLMVLDEAHNVDLAVSNHVKISFSNFFYKNVLGIKTPPVNAGQDRVYRWLINEVRPRLKEVIKKEAKKVGKTDDSNEAIMTARKLEKLKRSYSRIEHFVQVYDRDSWVLDTSKTDRRGERVYEFKPIDVGEFCQSMLYSYADRVLILSATILDRDVYCESVGINKNDAAFLRIPSPFPLENRPVHYVPVGSMSKSCIEQTLPDMAHIIQMLLQQHPDEKGIIHCVNYRIARHLVNALGRKRLLTHTSDDREEVIRFHTTSPHPTVLVSPSMMEGVDLADDMSRFQILCKVPFPYLGDAAVKKRMERSRSWYNYQTVKSVVQALGRSIRSVDDHAVSYILDADWERFYDRSRHMFPAEFSGALIVT